MSGYYPHLISIKNQLPTELLNFFSSKLFNKFSVNNCEYLLIMIYCISFVLYTVDTFDVYRSGQVISKRHF